MNFVGVSAEFDNHDRIAADLLGAVPCDADATGIKIGVLVCAAGIDYAAVLEKVAAGAPFPIIGGTTLAFPMTGSESAPVSATLALLTNNKMKVAHAVSAELDFASADEQMRALYDEARSALGGEPRLVVPYIPLLPGAHSAAIISSLFELSGGVCTGDLISAPAYVFANGQALCDKMVLLLVGGEVSPVFAVGNTITTMAEYGPEVTEAEDNKVKSVDDIPFCDYLKTLGIAPQDRVSGVDAIMQYDPLPVLVRYKGQPDDGVPEVRCIHYTDLKKGSAGFSAAIPVGSRVNVGLLLPDDVASSAKECLTRLMAGVSEGRARGYSYSAIFCVSCVGRYFVYVGTENKERRILESIRPGGLAVSDYYGLCEIGPTTDKLGNIINRSHSASIVMCAF